VAGALYVLGNIDVSLGDLDRARRSFVRGLALATELELVWGMVFSPEGLVHLFARGQCLDDEALVAWLRAERIRPGQ
jgi:hypothetical protein